MKLDKFAYILQILMGENGDNWVETAGKRECLQAIDAAIKMRYKDICTLELAKNTLRAKSVSKK